MVGWREYSKQRFRAMPYHRKLHAQSLINEGLPETMFLFWANVMEGYTAAHSHKLVFLDAENLKIEFPDYIELINNLLLEDLEARNNTLKYS